MAGQGWRLTEQDWRGWLEALLRQGTQIIAPIGSEGLTLFGSVSSIDDVSLADYGSTRWSPKEFLFPRTETLFSFRFLGAEVSLQEATPEEGERVLFALRPCDAAGLARLDDVFLGGEEDQSYARRREHTTCISLACDRARPECFCTAVGGSPAATVGSDLQLIPLQGAWLLRALTEKGARLVQAVAADWPSASSKDWAKAEEQERVVGEEMHRTPLSSQSATLIEKTFDDPLWASLGQRCLSCGICAYVCPSCSCFDMNDEGNAWCGTRCRSWDSCTFAMFTRQTSGHNPRPDQASRYRQRVLHKFAYFPLQHEGQFMCVGCGRCLKQCPVGLDIREIAQRVAAVGASRVTSS